MLFLRSFAGRFVAASFGKVGGSRAFERIGRGLFESIRRFTGALSGCVGTL